MNQHDAWFPFSSAGVKAVHVLMMSVSKAGGEEKLSRAIWHSGTGRSSGLSFFIEGGVVTASRVKKLLRSDFS